jgi:hypothetical protein
VILLTGTGDLVQVLSPGSGTLNVQASYVDLLGASVTPGRLNTAITSGTTTTVVGSPASSTQRTVKYLSISNAGASALAITIQHTDGTTPVQLQKLTLGIGYSLVYNEGSGWQLYDANGNIQFAISGSGRFIKRTVLTALSSTAFVANALTNSVSIRMVGGGGQGGGAPATTGENGSGGGSGAYCEWQGAVTPGASYNYQCGTGGTTGGTGANGQAGTSTTFTGPTTLTAPGGSGGLVGASITLPVLGGAGGTISTNGTLNCVGEAGGNSVCIGTALDNQAGCGGCSPLGSGGQGLLNISNATGSSAASNGYGGGGAGGTTTGTAHAGGAGANGCIIVDEFT